MKLEHNINAQNDIRTSDVVIVNGEAFTYKATGLTRRVFANADKTKVVKICMERGDHFNKEEIDIYTNASDEKRAELAETTQLDNGYIIQEYLHTLDDEATHLLYPSLTNQQIAFARSCRGDVGFDKNGVMKCHDLEEYRKY
jgi:hypothetical protein